MEIANCVGIRFHIAIAFYSDCFGIQLYFDIVVRVHISAHFGVHIFFGIQTYLDIVVRAGIRLRFRIAVYSNIAVCVCIADDKTNNQALYNCDSLLLNDGQFR